MKKLTVYDLTESWMLKTLPPICHYQVGKEKFVVTLARDVELLLPKQVFVPRYCGVIEADDVVIPGNFEPLYSDELEELVTKARQALEESTKTTATERTWEPIETETTEEMRRVRHNDFAPGIYVATGMYQVWANRLEILEPGISNALLLWFRFEPKVGRGIANVIWKKLEEAGKRPTLWGVVHDNEATDVYIWLSLPTKPIVYSGDMQMRLNLLAQTILAAEDKKWTDWHARLATYEEQMESCLGYLRSLTEVKVVETTKYQMTLRLLEKTKRFFYDAQGVYEMEQILQAAETMDKLMKTDGDPWRGWRLRTQDAPRFDFEVRKGNSGEASRAEMWMDEE